jgi:hypothetical protein
MLKIRLTDKVKNFAKRKALELGQLNNSIESGGGNEAGFIGEICALKIIGGKLVNTYDYDIVDLNGITWDAKTKRRSVAPKDNYYCSVAAFNTKQRCDNYIFISLEKDLYGHVLGWMSKEEFYDISTFCKKGELDPDSSPRYPFYFTADCYNIEIKKLHKFNND